MGRGWAGRGTGLGAGVVGGQGDPPGRGPPCAPSPGAALATRPA